MAWQPNAQYCYAERGRQRYRLRDSVSLSLRIRGGSRIPPKLKFVLVSDFGPRYFVVNG
jgi:hypothetical protein